LAALWRFRSLAEWHRSAPGVVLLAMVFNILNFENGLGDLTLSAYWQCHHPRSLPAAGVVIQARLQRSTDAD
jgi:galactofuranose transport system permease protein